MGTQQVLDHMKVSRLMLSLTAAWKASPRTKCRVDVIELSQGMNSFWIPALNYAA